MDEADAEAIRVNHIMYGDGLAIHLDNASIWPMNSAQDLDERGLARSVFSKQRVNFTRLQLEIDTFQGGHAAKPLADAAQLKEDGICSNRGLHDFGVRWQAKRDTALLTLTKLRTSHI